MAPSNTASAQPDPAPMSYYSAYRGIINNTGGNFDHFLRIPDALHRRMGYWRFKDVEDDRRAFARGLLSPEEVLIQQDRTEDNHDDIVIRWVRGTDDPNMIKPLSGTAAEHLQTIYELRHLLGKPKSLRNQIPTYPISEDARVKQYWEKKYQAQTPPRIDPTFQVPERPIPSPITPTHLQPDVTPLPVPKSPEGRITRARSAEKAQELSSKPAVTATPSRGRQKASNRPPARHPTTSSSTIPAASLSYTKNASGRRNNLPDNATSTAPSTARTSLSQLPSSQVPPTSLSGQSQNNGHVTYHSVYSLNSAQSQQQFIPKKNQASDSVNCVHDALAISSSGRKPLPLAQSATDPESSAGSYNVGFMPARPSVTHREVGSVPKKQDTCVGNNQEGRGLPGNSHIVSATPNTPDRTNGAGSVATIERVSSASSSIPPSTPSAPGNRAALQGPSSLLGASIKSSTTCYDSDSCTLLLDAYTDKIVPAASTKEIAQGGPSCILSSPLPLPMRSPTPVPSFPVTQNPPKQTTQPEYGAGSSVSEEPESKIISALQESTALQAHDMYVGFPCMDCGEDDNAHSFDCNIGNLNFTSKLTVLDYRELSDATERFDPGPWTTHYDQFPEPEPEDLETRISGMADVIRNEESYKMDNELHGLPDAAMVMLWAFKTSKLVQVVDVGNW